ncbi:MAG TPA: hypothetical protein VKH46_04925 [Thermoanaerobaculia bacterium]|jgi:hypothetical protein|nr:hypothetical protein [Thermoanaerobaculia bacterium]
MSEKTADRGGTRFAAASRTKMRSIVRDGYALRWLPAIAASLLALAPARSLPPPSSTSTPPPAASRHPRAHFFVGEVVEIVAAENRFSVRETLRDGSPKVTFFTAGPATTVFRGKDPATFADLRVNDHVTIKYADANGARKTLSIRITPSARSKPAAPPAKPPA